RPAQARSQPRPDALAGRRRAADRPTGSRSGSPRPAGPSSPVPRPARAPKKSPDGHGLPSAAVSGGGNHKGARDAVFQPIALADFRLADGKPVPVVRNGRLPAGPATQGH